MIQINDINLQNNEVEIIEKADKYASKGISKKIHIPNMNDFSIVLKGLLEQELETNYNIGIFEDIWHEPTWNYRVYITDSDMKTILSTPSCAPLVISLFSSPINPCYKLSEGCLYYLNTKDQNMIDLLLSVEIVINIEDKF